MSVTSRRLAVHTDKILKEYLLNGTLPDELVVERRLQEDLGRFRNVTTGEYTIEEPLWEPTALAYREISDVAKWNLTQVSAEEDIEILFADMLDDTKLLTDKLYEYTTRARLVRSRLTRLLARIENLILLSDDSDGFLFSFFDTFNDTSLVSLTDPVSSVLVDVEQGIVQLATDPTTAIAGVEWEDTILNLNFLQDRPNEVSFTVMNPLESAPPLSSTPITAIFQPNATAWQRELTITGVGPLVSHLTVLVSPLEPVAINRIEIATKMTNYADQLLIQVMYSQDGVSFHDVKSANNPQYVGQSAVFSFEPAFATHFRFIITKMSADSGRTYNIGFQHIGFVRTQYKTSGDLYSTSITMPDNRPIGKVACEVCEIKPQGTDIEYFIVAGESTIPISPADVAEPRYSKIIDLGALHEVSKDISADVEAGYAQWVVEVSGEISGRLSASIYDLTAGTPDSYEDLIPQTLTIYRNIGDLVTTSNQPYGVRGYQVNPSGLPSEYYQTYCQVTNADGQTYDFGTSAVVLDNKITLASALLSEGLHKVATTHYDNLQAEISSKSDRYFAWNGTYVSPFDFYNNFGVDNYGVFTYDPATGKVIMNPLQDKTVLVEIDYEESFVPADDGSGQYRSAASPLPFMWYPEVTAINAGAVIDIETDGTAHEPKWVNEVHMLMSTSSYSTISVHYSPDAINWYEADSNVPGPVPGNPMVGVIRFDRPVYAKYIRLYFVAGSNLDFTNGYINLFAPVLREPGILTSTLAFMPAGTIWSELRDSLITNISQTHQVYDAFDDALLNEYSPGVGGVADISAINCPKLYLKTKSNTGSDPYIAGITLEATALTDERSLIKFAYIGTSSEGSSREIRFKAHLSSTVSGLTPELHNYRVKIL